MARLYIFITYVTIVLPRLHGQNSYIMHRLTIENGLAASQAIGFTQDKKGFIWIATGGGLQRYDGKNFVTYRHVDNDSSSLFYDEVFNPVTDAENNIWVKNPESYINIINTRTDKVKQIVNKTDAGINKKPEFIAYCKDAHGTMWLCTLNALFIYDYQKGAPEKIATFPDEMSVYSSTRMICDTVTGKIWISTKNGIAGYDPQKKIFQQQSSDASVPAYDAETYTLFIDSYRNFWIATWDSKLLRYNFITHSFKIFHIPVMSLSGSNDGKPDIVTGIEQDNNDNVWICTDYGTILKYDVHLDTFNVVINRLNEYAFTGKLGVVSIFHDKEGNIWIATGFGVYFFNPEKQKIFPVQNNPFDKNSLPANQVTAFYQTSDHLVWVASSEDEGGVSVFDEHFNLKRRLFHVKNAKEKKFKLEGILCFCEDNFKRLWMPSLSGKLISYNLVTGEINELKIPSFNYVIYSIIKDSDGNLWISSGTNLIKFNPANQSFVIYKNLAGQSGLPVSEVRDMLIDHHNNFWIGTMYSGLFCFDREHLTCTQILLHNRIDDNSVRNNGIVSLSVYNDSCILVGTQKGIGVLNTFTKKYTFLRCTDGDLSNVIQGINCDADGNIFADTFHGLYRINGRTAEYTHYNYDDGSVNDQFYTKMYKLRDGRLLAGGLNNFIYFDPADLKKTFTPPDVQISGFKIFDRQYQVDSSFYQSNSTIHLGYKDNFITLQYSSLFYSSPQKIHYYYKLYGVDKDWVNAGEARYVSYTDLKSGNYRFEVKCVNDEGIISKNTSVVYIDIATAYYKSWWFILLCSIAVAAILYGIYSYRVGNLKKFSLMRRRIASDLHDDIGSTLNSISVYSEIASRKLSNSNDQIKAILEKMGDASRNMIDRMNDIVWAINPKNDEFENILLRMQLFAGELLSGKNILLQLDVDPAIQKIKLSMEKRKCFYLIFKEAVNNAYKYSESSLVTVSIKEKEDHIVMSITDNGKGFNNSTIASKGNGLKNMRLRSDEINAKLEINSWEGKGTRIMLAMSV